MTRRISHLGISLSFAVALSAQYTPPSGGGGGGTPGGSNTQVQFNDSATFGGNSGFTFDKATGVVTIPSTVLASVGGSGIVHGSISAIDVPLAAPLKNGSPFSFIPKPDFAGNGNEFVGSGLNDLGFSGHYTGTSPAVYTVKISSAGTPDAAVWRKDNGSWSSPTDISEFATITMSDGIGFFFPTSTGHTLGDQWLAFSMSAMIWLAQPIRDIAQGVSSSLINSPGSVNDGDHTFGLSFVTGSGESYLYSGVPVTISDHTVAGQVLIEGLLDSSGINDPRVLGYNIWATKAGGTDFYLVEFVPKGPTSYTYNRADSSLTQIEPAYIQQIDSSGPCIYGENSGAYTGQCVMQLSDNGGRFPLGGINHGLYWFDGFPNGIFGTKLNKLVQFSGTTGKAMCWKSDNTPGVCASVVGVDGSCTCN